MLCASYSAFPDFLHGSLLYPISSHFISTGNKVNIHESETNTLYCVCRHFREHITNLSLTSIYTSTSTSIMNQQDITRPNDFVWNYILVVFFLLTPAMKVEQCSETSSHKIQTPGNHPKERIQHSKNGENLKSRMMYSYDISKHVFMRLSYAFIGEHIA